MTRSILVPHDGSEHAQVALEYALETFPDATIVLFHAIDPFDATTEADDPFPLTEAWLERRRDAVAELFDDALEELDELEGEAETATIETETAVGEPAQTIVAYAEEADVDGIVLGTRGRSGVEDLRLGSTAELVVRRATVSVTVAR